MKKERRRSLSVASLLCPLPKTATILLSPFFDLSRRERWGPVPGRAFGSRRGAWCALSSRRRRRRQYPAGDPRPRVARGIRHGDDTAVAVFRPLPGGEVGSGAGGLPA